MANLGPNVVFDDEDGDGIQDPDEPPIANVTIGLYCYDENGTAVLEQTVATDENGTYIFNGIMPGLCYIQVTPPAVTSPDGNETDYVFSPIVPGGNQIYPNGTSPTIQIEWNDNITAWDVGVFLPVTLGNKVWYDLNGNGIQDAVNGTMEKGVEGVEVQLLNTNDDTVATTITAADGSYWFTGIPPGDYAVKVGPVPINYVFAEAPTDHLIGGPPPELMLNGVCYNMTTMDYMIADMDVSRRRMSHQGISSTTPHQNLTSGENNTSFDAGIFAPVQITGLIFEDLNGNGVLDVLDGEVLIGGATVQVFSIDPESGNVTEVGTITSSDGTYSLDLPPGTYQATITPPTPDHQLSPLSDPEDTGIGNDFDPLTSSTIPIVLLSGEIGLGSFDAGFYEPVSITNQVFNDTNGNGIREPMEPGYPGPLTIYLYDPNSTNPNEPIANTTIDVNGNFNIPNVPPGNYILEFVPADNITVAFIPQDIGDDDCADSDVDPETGRVSITVTSGVDVTCVNAGLANLPSIGPNVIFEDDNGNGLQDNGEDGMPGVPVILYYPNGTVAGVDTTNGDGEYEFPNLEPGSYYISVGNDPDFDWSPVVNGGNQISPDPSAQPYGNRSPMVTLGLGDVDTTLDGGMYTPVDITGAAWHDLDADGVEDPGEPGLPNVVVTLYDGNGNPVGSQTTGPDGVWSFDGMPPGTYHAILTPPVDPSGNDWTLSPNSDFDPLTWDTTPLYFPSGSSSEGLFDTGLYLPAAIDATVWYDSTPNGVRDGDEEPFDQPVTIILYDENGNQVQTTQSNIGTGGYQFTGILPGSYYLEYLLPDNPQMDSGAAIVGHTGVTVVTGEDGGGSTGVGNTGIRMYYPDWLYEVQVCANDNFDPAWMEVHQPHYLYMSKEECCQNHFWWRMDNCSKYFTSHYQHSILLFHHCTHQYWLFIAFYSGQ